MPTIASHYLIEDNNGNITVISFYGVMDPANPETAKIIYPKGTKVTIFEPFYTMDADMRT
jgi:hypothetical protein